MALYSNPYLTNKPKPLAWGSENIFAPGQFDAQAQLERFNSTLPQVSQPEGADWGKIAQAAGTGLALAGNTIGMANTSLGIDTQAPGLQTSATGEPVYSGDFYNQASTAKPQSINAGEVVNSVGQGALAGAQFGPVGAGVGLISSVIGGGLRQRRQRREKARAQKSAMSAQENYNEASEAFDQSQASQFEYAKRMSNTNRLWNLYHPNN